MNMKDKVIKAARRLDAIKKLDETAAMMVAMTLYVQADKYEKFLLDGLADEEAVKMVEESDGKTALDKIRSEVILLGCCQRFRDDLIANYPPAKTAVKQYESLVGSDPSMVLFD